MNTAGLFLDRFLALIGPEQKVFDLTQQTVLVLNDHRYFLCVQECVHHRLSHHHVTKRCEIKCYIKRNSYFFKTSIEL